MNNEQSNTNPRIPSAAALACKSPTPSYLLEQIRRAPVITRTSTFANGDTFTYETHDLLALYPTPGPAKEPDCARSDDASWFDCFCPDCLEYGTFQWRNPVAARLLLDAVLGVMDALLESLDCGQEYEESGLDVGDANSVIVELLEGYLPDVVIEWIASLDPSNAVAWLDSLVAEVEMHELRLLAGEFPRPHCTGSEMALHLLINHVDTHLHAGLIEPDELLMGACAMNGFPIDVAGLASTLRETLFEDHDVLSLFGDADMANAAMSVDVLHPANWFKPFREGVNPWVTRIS